MLTPSVIALIIYWMFAVLLQIIILKNISDLKLFKVKYQQIEDVYFLRVD